MRYFRPQGLLAGFHADSPEPAVSELVHIGEQWSPMERRIGRHEHRVWELYYQIDGVSLWASGGKRFELGARDLFIAPPRVLHELINRPTGKHHFFFAAIDVAPVVDRHPILAKSWRARECVAVKNAEGVEAPFRQLIREVTLRLDHRAEGLRSALDYLIIETTRALGDRPAEAFVALHPAVHRAKQLLEGQSEEPWRLGDLARLVHLSPNHLAQLFTAEVGVSPRQFLLRERVRRAKELLRDSDAPVTSIALDLGFSSSQHFAKMFKKIAGRSALSFRRAGASRPRSRAKSPSMRRGRRQPPA
jgi:AraC-like DNA-binding protein